MSDRSKNPFQSPIEPSISGTAKPEQIDTVVDFGPIARKWEFYRLIYNGILITQTIAMALLLFGIYVPIPIILISVFGAVFSNVCFFLGPAADAYILWLFQYRGKAVGLAIFIFGTAVTMLAAGAVFADLDIFL